MPVWDLYKIQPAFVLGFHGCDAKVAERIISGGDHIMVSSKKYDWLGSGAYFWEGSPHRAMEWAQDMASRPSSSPNRITSPAVVGAIIDLRHCFNLFDSSALDELRDAWEIFRLTSKRDGVPLPKNMGRTPDRLGRYLDRAVIEFMHTVRQEANLPKYDSVRAAFPEGGRLYPGAGFTKRAHIQIAVRDLNCIKGYFRPIEMHA